MKKSLLVFFAMALGLSLIIGGSHPALAQETVKEEFTLEEIVVTAQKREQELQDVPIAITVVGQEQLERQQVYTLQDLSRTTPGLEFGDGGPGGGAVVRGIGTSTLSGSQMEPSVGVVMDGVYMGSDNVGNIFDTERVEVLRGPQGTLFGKSASAGVIQIITAAPDFSGFKARVGVDVTLDDVLGSKFGRQEARAMVNVPLTENSAFRATVNGNFTQGIKKNKWPGMDDEESKNTNVRAKYLYSPSDAFSLNLIGEYAERRQDGPNLFTMTYLRSTPDPTQAPDVDFPLLAAYFRETCGITVSDENQDNCTDFQQFDRSKRYAFSAQIDWVMANHDFVSITSYKESTSGPYNQNIFGYGHPKINSIPEFVEIHLPGLPFAIYPGQQYLLDIRRQIKSENIREFISQEFRVSSPVGQKLDYVGGFYYSQTKGHSEGPLSVSQSWYPAPQGFVNQGSISTMYARGSYEHSDIAVFADANYPITDAFKILGGLRYSRYSIESYRQSLDPDSADYGVSLLNRSYDENFFTWRAGAQYYINPDTMTYATVSTGVKAPVIVREDPLDPESDYNIIAAEMPTSYEIGTKVAAFGNKLALDFNVFYNDITDYQGEECWYNETQDSLGCSAKTIDSLVSKGFEVDIFGRPIEGVTISAGYIYNIAEYPSGVADELTGLQIKDALKHKFTFSGEYGREVGKTLYGFVAVDATYKSEKRLNAMWYPSSIYPSCWVFGASIGIREFTNDKWNVTLFGRNLFNEPEPMGIYQSFHDQLHISITNERSYRQVGLKINYNF